MVRQILQSGLLAAKEIVDTVVATGKPFKLGTYKSDVAYEIKEKFAEMQTEIEIGGVE